MRRSAGVAAIAFVGLALGLSAQQSQVPTFRSSVALVDVDVSVLDDDRMPVRGLTAADFVVLENDRPQPIVAFSEVVLPRRERPSAEWMADTAPDVAHNDMQREGRAVVILFDQQIAPEDLPVAQRFAEAAVDQLRPGDVAAVAFSTFGVPQNFTADRTRLLAAIRQPMLGLPAADGAAPSLCRCGACSLETIGDIAEALAPVRQRRKVLLVIGSNIPIHSNGPCSADLNPLRERAFRALDAGNVTVHAFDPGGLPTLVTPAGDRSGAGGRGRRMANLVRLGNLLTMPDRTGGRFVADPVRPADRVAEIFRESDSYYVLGFQPAHTEPDGRYHGIRVRVNRRGVTLQARRGYYGGLAEGPRRGRRPADEDDGLSASLRTAVSGLWPRSEIAMAVAAAPVATPDLSRSAVAAVVNVRQTFDEGGSLPDDDAATVVNLYTAAFDRLGRALASDRQTLSVVPRRAGVRTFEYEVVSRLDLEPGRYELRTAIEDTRVGRTGSVYTYVDVPDYRRAAVAMSGLFLTADSAPPATRDASLDALVRVSPTTQRTFAAGDRVSVFARLYQGVARAMTAGYATVEILDEHDTSVYRQETRLVPSGYGASRAVDFSVDLPVDRLAPGNYLLRVEARHGNESAQRSAVFSIRQ
jgi:VWFA-related protein